MRTDHRLGAQLRGLRLPAVSLANRNFGALPPLRHRWPNPFPLISLAKGAQYFTVNGTPTFLFSRNLTGIESSEFDTLLGMVHDRGDQLVRVGTDSPSMGGNQGFGYDHEGNIDEGWSGNWERFLAAAEKSGIYVLPFFTGWADWNDNWKINPFNSVNGGPASSASQIYKKDSPAQQLFLKWFKSVVERWQNHRNIIGWECDLGRDGFRLDERAGLVVGRRVRDVLPRSVVAFPHVLHGRRKWAGPVHAGRGHDRVQAGLGQAVGVDPGRLAGKRPLHHRLVSGFQVRAPQLGHGAGYLEADRDRYRTEPGRRLEGDLLRHQDRSGAGELRHSDTDGKDRRHRAAGLQGRHRLQAVDPGFGLERGPSRFAPARARGCREATYRRYVGLGV